MTLRFGSTPSRAQAQRPSTTPSRFFDAQTVNVAKQTLQVPGEIADLGTVYAGVRPSQKGMMAAGSPAQAPVQERERVTLGDAAHSIIGRELSVMDTIAEHPTQFMSRNAMLHQENNREKINAGVMERGMGFMRDTVVPGMAQGAADMQRQMESLQNQQLRGDRTPVAGPSPAALEFAVKNIYKDLGPITRQPNVM